jgi:hypothetical protein
MLRAKEAAPLLVKALEHPVPFTEFRLGAALALVATENEVDGIARLTDALKPDEVLGRRLDLLRALLNTHSERAIPPLVRLLKSDPDLIRSVSYDPDFAESATAFGLELLGKLADAAGPQYAPTLRALAQAVEAKLAALPKGTAYVARDSMMDRAESGADYSLRMPGGPPRSFDTVMAQIKADEQQHQRELQQAREQVEALKPEERESSGIPISRLPGATSTCGTPPLPLGRSYPAECDSSHLSRHSLGSHPPALLGRLRPSICHLQARSYSRNLVGLIARREAPVNAGPLVRL